VTFLEHSVVVGGLRFYRDSSSVFCLLSFFVSYPPSSLNRTQPKPATCLEVSAIWKCMSEIWVSPPPTNRRAQTIFFLRLRNLTATLTACIFGMKYDIHSRISALQKLQWVSYIALKCHELWSTNGFKLDRHFYTPSVYSTCYFIARLRWRGSANWTQPNFAKWWTVNRANNFP